MAVVLLVTTFVHAQITWQYTFGGYGSDEGRSVKQTADGGFIVCGSTGSFGPGNGDVYVIKLDSLGSKEWSGAYGTALTDEGWSVVPLADGSVVGGTTYSGTNSGYDGLLIRLDDTGEVVWQKTAGTDQWDLLYDVVGNASGFLAVGQSYSSGSGDVWLVQFDADGDTLWTRTFGTDHVEEGRALCVTPDGGCVIAGSDRLDDGSIDVLVMKVDQNGALEWRRSLGGPGDQTGYGITIAGDSNFVVGGSTRGFADPWSMLMAKLNTSGDSLWLTSPGGGAEDWEGHEILALDDGQLVMAGYSSGIGAGGRDAYLIFTDPDGYWTFGPSYGGFEDDEFWAVDTTSDGGFVCVGSTNSLGPGIEAVFVVKTDGDTLNAPIIEVFDPLAVPETGPLGPLVLFPDPARPHDLITINAVGHIPGSGSIEVTLADVYGRPVHRSSLPPSEDRFELPDLRPGLYFITLRRAGEQWLSGRLVVSAG